MNSRDAADVGDRGASVIDELLLHKLVPLPLGTELLAHSDRNFHLTPQRPIDTGVLASHQILNEVGSQRLDLVRQIHGVRHVEFRMEVDAPGAILAHAFANLPAMLVRSLHSLEPVSGCDLSVEMRYARKPASMHASAFSAGDPGPGKPVE